MKSFTFLIASAIALSSLVAAQDMSSNVNTYELFMEKFSGFQSRYAANNCASKADQPSAYNCCHPIPSSGVVDPTCAGTTPSSSDIGGVAAAAASAGPAGDSTTLNEGDECNEGDDDCYCE